MSLDTSFYTHLVSLAPGVAVQQNTISEDKGTLRVWFSKELENIRLLTNGQTADVDCAYTVEVSGLDIDSAAALALSLKTSLHGYNNAMMGANRVLNIRCEDAADNYEPKDYLAVDEGFHTFTFIARILA